MIPDTLEKTTKIPVRIVNGHLECFYGGRLPDMKEGTIGVLIVPSSAITDADVLNRLHRSVGVELLPVDTILLIAVNPHNIPDDLRNRIAKVTGAAAYPPINAAFVELKLLKPLRLLLRGSKLGTLLETQCSIPSLKREVDSLNQAYEMISLAFEPRRKSHSGSVFRKAFFEQEAGLWKPIDALRSRWEAEYEHLLTPGNASTETADAP